MMDIQFQGFNPVFSTSLLFFLITAAIFFSWWGYAYLKTIPAPWRWALIACRGTALVLLIILLLNPFAEHEETSLHNPVIAVYLDDSQSMGIQRENYNGEESYRTVIENFNLENLENAEIRYFRFDGSVHSAETPDLELGGSITNLHEVMRHIYDLPRETAAAVMFSDGIVNRGRDPLFSARELNIPLYTVPVGDTTEIRDIAITEAVTNETGYVDTRQPVEVTVSQDGFPGESTDLRILRDGAIIDSETVEFDAESSLHRVTFELSFEEEGLHNFEAYAPELDEEVTTENNRYPFSVNVIDEKIRVVHVASEIHPDVSMFRSILWRDRNIDLETYTWTGDRYIEESQIDIDPDNLDLLVIHGAIPANSNFPAGLPDQIPVLQFLTPETASDTDLELILPIRTGNHESLLNIHIRLAESSRSHPVLDLAQPELSRLPALTLRDAEYELPATATVLYNASHEGSETGIPVIILEEAGNMRSGVVNAYGWFRYFQSADSRTREFIGNLMSNLTAWTSTSPDRENFRIGPGKQVYQEGEDIYFRGELDRETGDPESNAVIEVRIIHENGEERSYTMTHQTGGNYQLPIGSLTAGEYGYTAEARVAGNIIETAGGKFSVTPSILEYLNTKRNDAMLRELAQVTGGRFLDEQQPAALISDLHDNGRLDQIEESQTIFSFLHQHLIWFVMVILMLGAEWLLRRKYSLP